MTRQQTAFQGYKLIAGAALAGFGMFILYENLAGAFARMSSVIPDDGSGTLGLLPTAILAVSQVFEAHSANHQRFLEGFIQHMLVLFWPLLLVMVGTVLSRDTFTDHVNVLPERNCESVDLAALRSTCK